MHWQRPDRTWPGRSCQSIDDVMKTVADAAAEQNNIFFCVSSQRFNSGKRAKKDALGLRALFVDIDIDPNDPKKYSSLEQAITELFYFCQLLEIPRPSIIIATGGGLHAYWFSDRTLPVDEWLPFANALKTAARNCNLKIDAVVTGDAARILRVPGTTNYKYDPPRPVRFIMPYCNGIEHDFADVFTEMLALAPDKPAAEERIQIASAFAGLKPENLGAGININEAPPIPFEPIKAECGWLREAFETGGKAYNQPQWNLTTLCAVFMEDGHDLAHRFGNQHPGYNFNTTEKLWDRKNRERRDQGVGWPSCRAIQDAGSSHCAACPHLAKDRSPLHIGFEALKSAAGAEETEIKALGGSRPPELRLPQGYALDNEDRIARVFLSEVIKGKLIPGKLITLLLSEIWDPTFQFKDGQFGLGFTAATEMNGTTEVFLSTTNCYKPEMLTQLKKKSVLYATGKGVTDMAEEFMVSWLDKLRKEDKAARDPGTMGWRHDSDGKRIGFAYGDILYCADGTEMPLRTAGDDEFRSWYMPAGRREVWLEAAKLLTNRRRPELNIIIAAALAAPLATFSGTLYGAILSIWGPPGTSKSTAQLVAASIWGHPKQTRESLNSTPKSIQGRLGRTRNLAVYWDDVQDEKHQHALFETMFVASEGAEGGRLNPDASYKQRLEWQTLLVACSNASFVDYLLRKQKSTTAGIRRVFEVAFTKSNNPQGMVNPIAASQTFQQLEHHYGTIGAEYAKLLATEHQQVQALVTEITDAFREKVEGANDESFWWGTCGVLLAAAKLAERFEIDLDVWGMERFLAHAFMENRTIRKSEGTEGGTYTNTEQALTGFLNHYIGSGNVLFVDRNFVNRHVAVTILGTSLIAGRPIYVQIARDERMITISRKAFRDYLHDNDIQVRPVFYGLIDYFHGQEGKLTMGAGTVHAQTQEPVFQIKVAPGQHDILEEVLNAQGDAQIKSVVRLA